MRFFKKFLLSVLILTFLPHAISVASEPISPTMDQIKE